MLFLEVPLGIFAALKLWMPVLIQYCVDYAMSTISLFCAALYVRSLLMAVYKGVLRQPVPWFLNFRAVLVVAVTILLVVMAIVVVAIATKSMWLTAFALFLHSACAVAILVLGSAAYTSLWKAAAQSARASTSSRAGVHPMRKSLRKFLPGIVLSACCGAFLALKAVPRLSAQGPVPRDSGDLLFTTILLLVVFTFLVWLTWIPKPAGLPSAWTNRISKAKSTSKVAPLGQPQLKHVLAVETCTVQRDDQHVPKD
jgi:hypothetical protein